ncbi:uncharacterized protein LOC141632053 [Silene latifolia]|uniref:uncharacterized protein LOC141632053 n=1 Tax=Silene latifolia TaxID=37657 RepID=UPI003D7704AF
MKLIDKITARIRSWGAGHLTYSGRLALVNAVLSSLHSYWSSVFLIPNGILKKIDNICRSYLWGGGKDTYMKSPNINWDTCCTPKDEGGLGIKASKLWNKSLLGKYVWWIAAKKDHLWVKWVNHVYMKGRERTSYEPPSDCSWSWKKIASLFKTFAPTYVSGQWLGEDKNYDVSSGYNWLRDIKPKVEWRYVCWNRLNIPKTSFIYWAAVQGRLMTKDRLVRMGVGVDPACFLCANGDENHHHLFYACCYSVQCFALIQQALHTQLQPADLHVWFNKSHGGTKLQKRMVCAIYIAVIYGIWKARNKARVSDVVIRPTFVVKQILKDKMSRFWARNRGKLVKKEEDWLASISI